MRPVLLDTDIMSLFLRGDDNVVANVEKYLAVFDTLSISAITQYEILSGLYFKDAKKQLAVFQNLLPALEILPLNDLAIELASQKYAETRRIGETVDDMDLLIAGIALANNRLLITHNTKHFSKISNLAIQDWSLTIF